MKYRFLFLIPLVIVLALGCASNSTTTLTDQQAYLKLLGNYTDVTMSLNGEPAIQVNPENEKNLIYSYPDGIHVLELFRNGKLIYQKKIILEKGKTTEVAIP